MHGRFVYKCMADRLVIFCQLIADEEDLVTIDWQLAVLSLSLSAANDEVMSCELTATKTRLVVGILDRHF